MGFSSCLGAEPAEAEENKGQEVFGEVASTGEQASGRGHCLLQQGCLSILICARPALASFAQLLGLLFAIVTLNVPAAAAAS